PSLLFVFVLGCGDDDPAPADGAVDAGDASLADGGDAGEDATTDGDALAPVAFRAECENVNPFHCMLPWPSNRFLAADATTNTGFRIDVTANALPQNRDGDVVSSTDAWNRFDGFSPMTSMMTTFEGELDTSNLPDETRIADSLLPGSPTVLLDAMTGERVAHFSELDMWPQADLSQATFYIRPAQRLEENRRYIVAIRDLKRVDGGTVEASPYFAALRDNTPNPDFADLEERRPAFEAMFGTLETAGVTRAGLLEAWEFNTASGESAWGEMVWMRDDAETRAGPRGIGCKVDSVEDNPRAEIFRRVRGTFTVPLYVENALEGAKLVRDANGAVMNNGTAEAPFELVIPTSVAESIMAGGDPARALMYGHGLLGDETQVSSSGTRTALNRNGIVGFGTEYWGMGEDDEAWFITNVVTNFGDFATMAERIMQGTINSIVLARSMKGVCSELPELQIDGTPVIDTDQVYYYGISQGGIFGATIAGLSNDIEAYVLQVGAVSYPIMIRRSIDFDRFEDIYQIWYPSKLDRDFFLVASAGAWDQTDPATYAPHLVRDPLPNTTVKRILYQVSRYDTEVSNLASDIGVRTMGIPVINSSVYEPWNVMGTDGPVDSAYVIYHLNDVEPIPRGTALAAADNNAHSDLRFTDPMLIQLDMFLRPGGQVVDTCPMNSCLIDNPRAN
ncbi:MAG: hypothetical protein AAGF12_43090, partial [Myxococcota bacterium]